MRIREWLEATRYDVRFGMRQLRRTPGIAIATVLSLGIGIGANTAIFDVVNTVVDSHVAVMAALFEDARVGREAPQFHRLFVKYALDPAGEAQRIEWAEQTRRQLRDQYGEAGAARRLGRVRQFIEARPDVAESLGRTGLGDCPSVVLALAANANSLRIEPRD